MDTEELQNAECRVRIEDITWLPFVLQTADALFPTGAYAHSLGFEEMVRLGAVRDEATLREFLLLQIVPAMEHFELPMLRDAICADLARLVALDRELDAWRLPREAREASVQLGVRRLKALRKISDAPALAEFEQCIEAGEARGHHLVVCGLQAAVEQVPEAVAMTVYFYQALAAICSAALKLLRIGQDGCQRALRTACLEAESAVRGALTVTQPGWFNPMLEIAAMRHARAEERLFIS
jgi:urease accessory protein